jgi:hypothetical protein
MKIFIIGILSLLIITGVCTSSDSQNVKNESRWNSKYDFIYNIPAITFHYDHGVIAGSYAPGQETTEVRFDDVSSYLGHVCLCGAGGYRISQIVVDMMKDDNAVLEKGDFTLISSRDHTISDVIAYVFGCTRRHEHEKNQYFIDETIETPRREYHYYIGYFPQKKAVHLIYRKHLLIGSEQMDRLWKIELAYDQDPMSVSPSDMELYRDTMVDMVKEVLTGQKEGLFEAQLIDYDEFVSQLKRIKSGNL